MTNTNFKAIRKQGWHDRAEQQKIKVSTDWSDNCIPKSGCSTRNCLLNVFLFQQKYCNPSTSIIPHLQWCKVVELPGSVARAWRSGWKSLEEAEKISMSPKTGLKQFWSWRRSFNSLKLTRKCWRMSIQMSKEQQLDLELWRCLLGVKRSWRRKRGLCRARIQCLVFWSNLQGLVYHHLYCWTLDMTCLQFKKKWFLLKLSFIYQILYFV
jgi:hypothetical protein